MLQATLAHLYCAAMGISTPPNLLWPMSCVSASMVQEFNDGVPAHVLLLMLNVHKGHRNACATASCVQALE